jgi:hypothetical protein
MKQVLVDVPGSAFLCSALSRWRWSLGIAVHLAQAPICSLFERKEYGQEGQSMDGWMVANRLL